MPRSVYVSGVPYPSSKQQQQVDNANAARLLLQQQQSQGQSQQQAYGSRLAQPQYQGKPAFFDSNRGAYFDGQRAYLANDDTVTAIDVAQDGQQQQLFGQGYGVRVPLIKRLQQQLYQGKPAFYDPVHGVYYDGQQAYLYASTDGTSTAIELNDLGGQLGSQQQFFGQGYGNRVLLSPQVAPLQLQGKPAFFDSRRGLFFDGQNLYAYQPAQQSDTLTAVELSGQPQNYSASNPQQRARYQQLVQDLNENRSTYLFSA